MPDESPGWKKLLYQFTQNTTFHGVRYITETTKFILRRIIWLLLVLGVSTVFTWIVITRVIYFTQHPKTVNVEVIYTDKLIFPAVTICNQNFLRATPTHRTGLFDFIEENFRNLKLDKTDVANRTQSDEGEQCFFLNICGSLLR